MAGEVGIEPTTNGLTVRGSASELLAKNKNEMVGLEGIEPSSKD
jgi:hypothetical protein